VTLRVDDVQIGAPQNIGGVVKDCDPSANCLLYVGQRAAAAGQKNYGLTGVLYDARLLNNVALKKYPSA